MSKKDRKNGLLVVLQGLRDELRNAIDAVDSMIDEVSEANSREELVDAVSGCDWDDLEENADYINGSVLVLKDLRLVMDEEETAERNEEENEEE